MKTIILATDFSPAALNAANYAAELATDIGAELLLLNVYYLFESYSELPSLVTAGQLEEDARTSMDELKKVLNDQFKNLSIHTGIKRGLFIRELRIECEKVKPYFVVVGSQGASATDYRFFGSQSVLAMKDLKWPVIAVPQGRNFTGLKNIGIACDLQNGIDHVPTKILKELVTDFKASLHILNASGTENQQSEIIRQASVLMEALAPVHHEFHFINGGDEDNEIIEFAEKHKFDLLIVLPRKHSLFDKWFHKSYTRKLVLNLQLPVMSLHLEN